MYDGLGNRVAKQYVGTDSNNKAVISNTFYRRDAQGNSLAVYKDNAHDIEVLSAVNENSATISGNSDDVIGTDISLSTSYTITSDAKINYTASNSIVLKPGFNAEEGAEVNFSIDENLEDGLGNSHAIGIHDAVGFRLQEHHIYGSSRLGLKQYVADADGNSIINSNTIGNKRYELSNHLGNVMAVITDRKIPIFNTSNALLHYEPEVIAFNDYYPFGMLVPNRNGSSDSYRYGFQGQEKDDEVKGGGNSINYKYRMHDPRVGRFFAVDPLTMKYPHYSPYSFSGNKLINSRELEGLEEYESYKAYQMHGGTESMDNLDGSNGVWFSSDGESKNNRWSKAMEYITKQGNANLLEYTYGETSVRGHHYATKSRNPFGRVRDYYLWAQNEMDTRGYRSQWAKGASYLVDDLSKFSGLLRANAVGSILTDLNLGIASFATSMFRDVLYNSKEVTNWYDWDLGFIRKEQGPTAFPIYKKYKDSSSLYEFGIMSNASGYFPGAKSFPKFSDFGADVTNPSTNFGELWRVNIPMLMLYTFEHINKQSLEISKEQMKQIIDANENIQQFYKDNKISN